MTKRIRQQGKMPSTFDGRGHQPLMLEAGAGLAARLDLAAIAHVHAQAADVLGVRALHVVRAEAANLAAAAEAGTLLGALGAVAAVAGRAATFWSFFASHEGSFPDGHSFRFCERTGAGWSTEYRVP